MQRGVVYCSPDVDARRFAPLLAGLELQTCSLDHPELVDVKARRVFLLSADALADARLARAVDDLSGDLAATVVLAETGQDVEAECGLAPAAWLEGPVSARELRHAMNGALRQIGLQERARGAEQEIDRRTEQLADLHHVGVALSAVHDVDALQTLILSKARAITSADAGSLYLVIEDDEPALDQHGQPLLDADGEPVARKVKLLAFNKAQNFSNPSDFKALRMPLDAGIAGYVATKGDTVHHDDIYHLPADAPYQFNAGIDEQTGYRSKSMLAVPMVNADGLVIGVIQLINRKYRPDVVLSRDNVDDEVLPFSLEDLDLTLSFASQAAVALDNRRLIDSIQTLFEGFVTASVQAIESRDPTTSGHSGRVATLTVGLAEALNATSRGPLAEMHFSQGDIREIRYAAVLHDFGKVGVREHILVKAKKLEDWQIEEIRGRFGVARAALESQFLRRKLDVLLAHGPGPETDARLAAIDAECERAVDQLARSFELVRQSNEPSVLASDSLSALQGLSGLTYAGDDGRAAPLVEPPELRKLAIPRGSLDTVERLEIESHVTHTYKFLTKIPWTHELRRVPEIAWAHHEKLDGTGYPNGLTSEFIPAQSKMMAIADIYDALTAWDRPYKKAVPTDRALDILHEEARSGHIDGQLLDLFTSSRIYLLTAR
ncbi:MAG: GAF domain-containing protein [Chloroflexi bacterium]|nr:GAF domain-containing protein [Chloroflexota bacterium]